MRNERRVLSWTGARLRQAVPYSSRSCTCRVRLQHWGRTKNSWTMPLRENQATPAHRDALIQGEGGTRRTLVPTLVVLTCYRGFAPRHFLPPPPFRFFGNFSIMHFEAVVINYIMVAVNATNSFLETKITSLIFYHVLCTMSNCFCRSIIKVLLE